MRTQGEIEAAICDRFGRFEREYRGRGPKDIRAFLLDDFVVVRLQGLLTPAEQQLARFPSEKGRDLLKHGVRLPAGEGGRRSLAYRVCVRKSRPGSSIA